MTRILYVRHGEHDFLGRAMVGRMTSVHLNARGRAQAEALGEELGALPLDAIYVSPLERAQETAQPLVERLGIQPVVTEEINEVDFGEWTGWTLQNLHAASEWSRFNMCRSVSQIPGGESMLEVQARMVRFMRNVQEANPDGIVAAFCHGDPIKLSLMHCLGMPIDFVHRFDVFTASVSAIELGEGAPQVTFMNRTAGMMLDPEVTYAKEKGPSA